MKDKKMIQPHGFTTGASFGLGLAGISTLSGRYDAQALSITFIIMSIALVVVTIINKKKLQK